MTTAEPSYERLKELFDKVGGCCKDWPASVFDDAGISHAEFIAYAANHAIELIERERAKMLASDKQWGEANKRIGDRLQQEREHADRLAEALKDSPDFSEKAIKRKRELLAAHESLRSKKA